jgi:hypothetical protein
VVEGAGFLLAVLPAPGLLRLHLADPLRLSRALGWWGTYMPMGTALALAGVPMMAWSGWRGVVVAGLVQRMLAALVLALGAGRARRGAGAGACVCVLWPRLARTLGAPGPGWWRWVSCSIRASGWPWWGSCPPSTAQAGFEAAAVAVLSALAAGST